MNANDLLNRLAAKYTDIHHLFFDEFRDNTGYGSVRIADGLAIELYKHEIIGFEIKVSRADLMNELKDPDKSERIKKYCSRWFMVMPKDLATPEEIPVDWGILIPRGDGLQIKRGARKLTPQPLSLQFVCSLLCRMRKDNDISKQLNDSRYEGYREGFDKSKEYLDKKTDELRDATQRLDSIKRTLGFNPWSVTHEEILSKAAELAELKKDNDKMTVFINRIERAAIDATEVIKSYERLKEIK